MKYIKYSTKIRINYIEILYNTNSIKVYIIIKIIHVIFIKIKKNKLRK